MPTHVMLDLETWGTGNTAAVVSIGACIFDAEHIHERFHTAIDPRSCQRYGAQFDADTLLWWMSVERREALDNWLSHPKIDLDDALNGFSQWLGIVDGIWGNGATFDNVILRSAYAAVGQPYPVRFWQDQCYRTLKYRAPTVELVREGIHHNALDDAVSQAKHLQAILKTVGAVL